MAHLTGFGLENFRVFKDYTWFDFAPITILVGPNNSGKSSLIKALLLLKDNVEQKKIVPAFEASLSSIFSDENGEYNITYLPRQIDFSNPIHGINSAVSMPNSNSNNIITTFDVRYNSKNDDILGGSSSDLLIYRLSISTETEKNRSSLVNRAEVFTLDKRLLLKVDSDHIFFNPYLYDEILDSTRSSLLPGLQDLHGLHYKKILSEYNKINFQVYKKNAGIHEWCLQQGLDSDVASQMADATSKNLRLGEFTANSTNDITSPLDILKQLHFWTTSRSEQKRVYSDTDNNSFRKLLQDYNNSKLIHNFDDLLLFVSEEFNIKGVSADYEADKGIYFPNINGRSLMNHGFGYTQLSSLLFKIIGVSPENYIHDDIGFIDNSTLILEEPEANLHPKFQSKLADLFKFAKENYSLNFLIETHSEYMIRKFQYLVAKGEMKPEDIIIHYFHDPNDIPAGEKQVKKITILEDGSLSDDFGPGFFDEAATWELELIKLKKSKARQN